MDPYRDVLVELLHEFPEFRLRLKVDSLWMRAIDVILRMVTFGHAREFMTRYTTTVGMTMYVPMNWTMFTSAARAMILRHERVHLRQQARLGRVLFSLVYLVPFFPVFLAYGRARLELEAYTESLRAAREYGGDLLFIEYQESVRRQFTTGAYGWMWPFKKTVARWVREAADRIVEEGRVVNEQAFQ